VNSPGNWTLRASLAKSPDGGYTEPPLAVSQPKAAVPTAGRSGAQRPWPRPASVGGNRTERPATGRCGLHLPSPLAGAATNRPWRFRIRRPQFSTAGRVVPHRPHPRPPPVGRNRTERPATGRCGLRLQSPLPGAAINRPRGFASTEGRSLQLPAASEPRRPLAASIIRGWKPHRTPGNWTLRASLAKPPHGGCTEPPPAVSPHEGRSFQLQAVSGSNALRPRPSSVGGSRTERPATGRHGLRLLSPLPGAAINRRRRFRR